MILANLSPQPRSRSGRSAPARRAGFSLVEVAMSLGIFAFGTLGLIGLLPVALTNHQEAKLDTVLAQITQRLAAEVVLTDAERLLQLDGFVRAFDAEGRELPSSSDSAAVYRARIALETFETPGLLTGSQSLRRAVIYAMHDPVGNKIGAANAVATGSVLVARAESAPPPAP